MKSNSQSARSSASSADTSGSLKTVVSGAGKRRNNYEEKLQIEMMRVWLLIRLRLKCEKGILFHIPNGGKRSKAEGGRFKAMGTVSGVADLFLMQASGPYHGLFIEVKTNEGTQSPTQKEFQSLTELNGYKYSIARSVEQFKSIVTNYILYGG